MSLSSILIREGFGPLELSGLFSVWQFYGSRPFTGMRG